MTNWTKQEPGWYTSDIGGISEEEKREWFFWPKTLSTPKRFGPWKTLKEAKDGAEAMANSKSFA